MQEWFIFGSLMTIATAIAKMRIVGDVPVIIADGRGEQCVRAACIRGVRFSGVGRQRSLVDDGLRVYTHSKQALVRRHQELP